MIFKRIINVLMYIILGVLIPLLLVYSVFRYIWKGENFPKKYMNWFFDIEDKLFDED